MIFWLRTLRPCMCPSATAHYPLLPPPSTDPRPRRCPPGIPFVYELDEHMRPIHKMQFLGDPETVKKAMESVANQGKAK